MNDAFCSLLIKITIDTRQHMLSILNAVTPTSESSMTNALIASSLKSLTHSIVLTQVKMAHVYHSLTSFPYKRGMVHLSNIQYYITIEGPLRSKWLFPVP